MNISFYDIDDMNVVEYKYYLREAFIYNCSLTEQGIEFLCNAKRLETTEPERDKLREKMNSDKVKQNMTVMR